MTKKQVNREVVLKHDEFAEAEARRTDIVPISETYQKDVVQIPVHRFLIEMPSDRYDQLKRRAKQRGVSVRGYVRQVIFDALDKP